MLRELGFNRGYDEAAFVPSTVLQTIPRSREGFEMRLLLVLLSVLSLFSIGALSGRTWNESFTDDLSDRSDVQELDASLLVAASRSDVDEASEQPLEITPDDLHQLNTEGFRNAEGFGISRGGAHILLNDGSVQFIEGEIAAGTESSDQQTATNYGLWGSLGTRRKIDEHPELSELSEVHWVSTDAPSWKLDFVQLVSLQQFDPPVAYDESELPRMHQLQSDQVPTRSLTEFEVDAIGRLRAGAELIEKQTATQMFLLGAIRASGECMECHTAESGDLLGAFSYRLSRR
ncbi:MULTISPECIES: hypothetical protein [Rhodopirellula]|uniref:hypothetical protein n=1 Tax=Rhodopirellula TaxID=265488 RepID=UPI00257C4402|nr:hypothetical protein [Rhodopirellula sp. UBA1907]|tara:strand:- start:680 stop:1546 length:867 start_codon:yes stop_codon:yes gene_type:complete